MLVETCVVGMFSMNLCDCLHNISIHHTGRRCLLQLWSTSSTTQQGMQVAGAKVYAMQHANKQMHASKLKYVVKWTQSGKGTQRHT